MAVRYALRIGYFVVYVVAVMEPCNDPGRIRFVCMGSGLLKDGATLGEYHLLLELLKLMISLHMKGPKFPIFPDHPTPINVSVKPPGSGDSVPSKTKTPTQSNATGIHESLTSADQDDLENTSPSTSPCRWCCSIS